MELIYDAGGAAVANVLEPVLQDPPAMPAQPFRGDAFAEEAKGVGIGRHGQTLAAYDTRSVILATSTSSQALSQLAHNGVIGLRQKASNILTRQERHRSRTGVG